MQLRWDRGLVVDQGSFLSLVWQIIRIIKFETAPVFVFHMQSSLPLLVATRVLLLLMGKTTRLVYDIHDLLERPRDRSRYRYLRYVILYGLEALTFRWNVRILTVSRGLSRIYYLRYQRSPVVVYNIPRMAATKLQTQKKRSGVVYFGQISAARLSIKTLEEIAIKFGEIHVHGVFSKGVDPEYMRDLRRMVDKQQVVLHGRYDPDDLSFLDKYNVSLMLFSKGRNNIRFCMPNKLFQSLARGVPCMISESLREVQLSFRNFPEWVFQASDLSADRMRYVTAHKTSWEKLSLQLRELEEISRIAYLRGISFQ